MAKRELSSNVRKLRFMQSNTVEKKRVPMKLDSENPIDNDTSGSDMPWYLDEVSNIQGIYDTSNITGEIKGKYKVRYYTRRSFGEYNKIVDHFEKRTDDTLSKLAKNSK